MKELKILNKKTPFVVDSEILNLKTKQFLEFLKKYLAKIYFQWLLRKKPLEAEKENYEEENIKVMQVY